MISRGQRGKVRQCYSVTSCDRIINNPDSTLHPSTTPFQQTKIKKRFQPEIIEYNIFPRL